MRGLIYVSVMVSLVASAALFQSCSQGNTGPAGPSGNSGVPTPVCSNPSSQGYTVTSVSGSFSGLALQAEGVTITNPTTATSLSIYVASASVSGQLRMAIYSDNGSTYPGALVAQTTPQNFVGTSWNTISLPNVFLQAGTYWLAFIFTNPEDIADHTSGGNHNYILGYGWSEFPDTFPTTGASNNTAEIAFYVSTCP